MWFFICISLVTFVAYLFTCLFTNHISSLEMYLFNTFTDFQKKIGLFSYCWVSRGVCVCGSGPKPFIYYILFFCLFKCCGLDGKRVDRLKVVICITFKLHTFCHWFTWYLWREHPWLWYRFYCAEGGHEEICLGEQIMTRMNWGRTT